MQEAIPYKSYTAATAAAAANGTSRSSPLRNFLGGGANGADENSVTKLVVENAVVVFGRRGCCMCHVVKSLLLGHGVNPVVWEVEEEKEEAALKELSRINDHEERSSDTCGIQFPAVFVGGKLFGGMDKVMSTHISGELVPILKDAGALWL